MTDNLTEDQRTSVESARDALRREVQARGELAAAVRHARQLGLPILYLADALGVSRTRIRKLAR